MGGCLVSLVVDYIIALTNLYGLVSKEKMLEIYNMQNSETINMTDLNDEVDKHIEDLEHGFAFLYGDYFVNETIYIYDEFDEQMAKRQGKPHYIPDKKELLKYKDQYYFEKPKEYRALLRYVERHFFKNNRYYAQMLCEDIHLECSMDFKLNDIFYQFERRDIVFESEDQVGKVIDLVMDLANNVRLWDNNGFTQNELASKMRKNGPNFLIHIYIDLSISTIKDVHTKEADQIVSNIKHKKIGRNDPCPCGSGKKYKKCCLN